LRRREIYDYHNVMNETGLPNLGCAAALARLALTIACLVVFAQGALATPVIFNWSSIAGPGDIVNLQGHDFGKCPEVWCSTNGGPAVQSTVVNSGNDIVHVKVPSLRGLYGLYVKNGSSISSTVYVNRANPMHLDTPEVSAGGRFRIFGRNLCIPGAMPQVKFVSGNNSYNATIALRPRFSAYNVLSVDAPTQIPQGNYTVQVSNGMGSWALAQAPCQEPLTVRCAGPDWFKLGVPWAADFTFGTNVYNVRSDPRLAVHADGDGVHNDQPAIQNAIDIAGAAGGGVVYLPEGIYKMQTGSGPLMDFKNKVVVRGAGQNKTKINYGYEKPGAHFWVAMFSQTSCSGLCDLAIQNQNEHDAWLNTGTIANCGPGANEIFLARIKANFQNGDRVELKGDRIVVAYCNLTSVYTLLYMGTCINSLVYGNTLTQTLGVHLDVTESNQCVVENNTFILDANRGRVVKGNVRHGMAIGFAHNLAIIKNTWSSTNGTPAYNNDGEAILSEGGAGIRTGEETGTVTSAEGSSVSLSKNVKFVKGTVIAIINGTGMGQWRTIIARQGKDITVDRPWAVSPDSTSNYSIFIWNNQNTTISGNTFSGWLRGIWFYQASTTDSQIAFNTLKAMDGIFIEPCQNVTKGNGQFNPVWNTLVNDNILSSGKAATYINFTGDLQQTERLIGTMALNDNIYHNTISATGATFFENDPANYEGFCNYLRVEAPRYDDQTVPAMSGTLFQWNKLLRHHKPPYLLNGGDYWTTIGIPDMDSIRSPFTDSKRYWNTPGEHGSIGTVLHLYGLITSPSSH
jgi:hypothetical protein